MENPLIALLYTWGLGLLPAYLIRFQIYKKPLKKRFAIPIALAYYTFHYILSVYIRELSGVGGRPTAALSLVAIVSFLIMIWKENKAKVENITSVNSVNDQKTDQTETISNSQYVDCKKCGTKNNDTTRHCIKCGMIIPSKDQLKLSSIYNWTGNISILFGILGFVTSMVVGFSLDRIIGDVIGALFFNLPRLYYGYKIKHSGVGNLKYALKVSGGMFLYSLAVVLLNLATSYTGILYIIPAIFYFLSYRATKQSLKS